MNCGFCEKELSPEDICWGCFVGYNNGRLIDSEGTREMWPDIPEGCLFVVDRFTLELI